MRDIVIIHESVLYDAFGENVDNEQQELAEKFLNGCGKRNYDGENFAYLPGETFHRICGLSEKWEEFISFCEMLIIKFSKQGCGKDKNNPYVFLASDLCTKNSVFLIASNKKFKEWVSSEGYMFPIFSVKSALNLFFNE